MSRSKLGKGDSNEWDSVKLCGQLCIMIAEALLLIPAWSLLLPECNNNNDGDL